MNHNLRFKKSHAQFADQYGGPASWKESSVCSSFLGLSDLNLPFPSTLLLSLKEPLYCVKSFKANYLMLFFSLELSRSLLILIMHQFHLLEDCFLQISSVSCYLCQLAAVNSLFSVPWQTEVFVVQPQAF